MDLNQRKLTKAEWESIEIPVSSGEMQILRLIMSGYNNVNIRINNYNSLITFLKIDFSPVMEEYLYNKYFSTKVNELIKTYGLDYASVSVNSNPVIKKADIIRIQQNTETSVKNNDIYEFTLLENVEKMLKFSREKEVYYYTIYKLMKNSIPKLNQHVVKFIQQVLDRMEDSIDVSHIIYNAVDCIERNYSLLKYADLTLYEHQKEIFSAFKSRDPKLVLYIAPTGTGKSKTPLGLAEGRKIIYLCAARHVGLDLARAAISMNKKVAFAFGCNDASDIRLHYFAAKEYTIDRRSGGIRKVDNSIGDKVEIMICDIKSYIPAMYYMKAFLSEKEMEMLTLYWDEPTITLDYGEHELHETIREIWRENIVTNIVLSSATLPKIHEISDVIADFKTKFGETATVINIVSHDCKKSIPVVNKEGYVVLPHYLDSSYENVLKIAAHCSNYLTILRYFDLAEIIRFIRYVITNECLTNARKFSIERNFASLDDIDMKNIKLYYLKVLMNINQDRWYEVHQYFMESRVPRVVGNSKIDTKGNIVGEGLKRSVSYDPDLRRETAVGISRARSYDSTLAQQTQAAMVRPCEAIYVTTKDAHTLTDGPTIFLSNDVEKVAKFYIQQSNIPSKVIEDIMTKIEYNNKLNEKINILEKELEDINEKKMSSSSTSNDNLKKMNRDILNDNQKSGSDTKKIMTELTNLRLMLKSATLNDAFIPNTLSHLKKWVQEENPTTIYAKAFTSNVEERIVGEIMLLYGINDSWKILLMMGIGVFTNHNNITYTEIMKKLADEQKLYMIIASSDYIYGTNYQFCHGYISKDLVLTQEKIIQAMGRIGRSNIQQDYSVRFRDDAQILKLFTEETDKPEVANMNRLFTCF